MNKCIFIGNLTRRPEQKQTASGDAFTSFDIAVNNGKDDTLFLRVLAFKKLGENCYTYLDKGKKVCVVGNLRVRKYMGKDNIEKTALELLASEVEFLSPREEKEEKTIADDEDLPF